MTSYSYTANKKAPLIHQLQAFETIKPAKIKYNINQLVIPLKCYLLLYYHFPKILDISQPTFDIS